MFLVTVSIDFDTRKLAEQGLSDMEEAAAKHNGDLQASDIENLDATEEEPPRPPPAPSFGWPEVHPDWVPDRIENYWEV